MHTAVIQGELVALPVQCGHNVRPDEVGPTDDEYPHTTSTRYNPSLTVSPAARYRNAPEVELTALFVSNPNSSTLLPLPQRDPTRPSRCHSVCAAPRSPICCAPKPPLRLAAQPRLS